jgi:hypothetical protein
MRTRLALAQPMKLWKSRKKMSRTNFRMAAIILPAIAITLAIGSAAQANYGGGAEISCEFEGDGSCRTPPIPANSYYNCINWRADADNLTALFRGHVAYQVYDEETRVVIQEGGYTPGLWGGSRSGTIHGLYGHHYDIAILGSGVHAVAHLNNNCT